MIGKTSKRLFISLISRCQKMTIDGISKIIDLHLTVLNNKTVSLVYN